jgi:hypothetical protein
MPQKGETNERLIYRLTKSTEQSPTEAASALSYSISSPPFMEPEGSWSFPPFMKPEGSLLCSQEPAPGPYHEPDESNPHPQTRFPEDILILSFRPRISLLVASSIQTLQPKFSTQFLSPHSRYILTHHSS